MSGTLLGMVPMAGQPQPQQTGLLDPALQQQLAAGQAAGAAMRAPPPQAPAPPTGTLPWAMAQGNALDQSQYGGLYSNLAHPSQGQLAAGMSGMFPSFNDPRLVADRLATAAQDPKLTDDERQKASDAFDRYQKQYGGSSQGSGGTG